MQPPHDGGVPTPRPVEFGHRVRAQPEGPPEPAQVGLVLGDHVGAAEPVELDAVLHRPQEAVGLVELGGVRPPDVSAVGERPQGLQGGADAQGAVAAPVDELEQLDGELDVPEPSGAELELAVDAVDGDVVDDAAAHLLHVADEVLPVGGLPHQGGDGFEVLRPQLRVARDGPGLEKGLELPGLGPALVVGEVRGDGPYQGSVAALGAEVGVDGPDGALDGGVGADPHHVGDQPGGGLQCAALLRAVDRFADEDHVDVGDVVQLVSPALAHRDDGDAALGGVGGRVGAGDGERRAQGGRREVGELGGDLGDVRRPADVTGRYRQQGPAVGDPQRVRVDDVAEHLLELADPGVQIGGLVGDQHLPVARMPCQMVPERLGGTEGPEQPVPQRLRGDEGVQQDLPLVGLLGLDQPHQAVQGQIGVGRRAEGVEEHGIGAHGGELGQVQQPFGGRGIGETVPQQAGERTASASRHRRHPCLLPAAHISALRA